MVSKIVSVIAATSTLIVCAQQPENNSVTIQDVASYIQSHAEEPTFFKKISLSLELKALPEVNVDKWRSLVHSFVDVALLAQHDTENKLSWLDMLGYPIKDTVAYTGDSTDIHGDLAINFTPDMVSLSGSIERNDNSTMDAWKQIVGIWCDVINRAVHESEIHDGTWDKGVGEMLVTALGSSQDGISIIIRLRFESVDGNHAEIGYTS